MTRYFNQKEIDEFKECFNFHARKGFINNEKDLSVIMRSLAYSPTKVELVKYFQKHVAADGRIEFSSFLDILHEHSKIENCEKELLAGFKAQDSQKQGSISTAEVKNILMNSGEKLSRNEVDALFRETRVNGGQVNYKQFLDALLTPSPDY
ncbi:hypothetical protein LOTGIDRAFT_199614 [Lottia gigantea]|uniref:EF-hand domain-containing protein n=1 Tax=Lottia gigantea TaxID=225164 RepID=V4AYC9_LOTGI|nr:hypothetical protein LOTGIDRAFT_199614 [Lottia gigantea]ESP02593.1 hypothetical protein LOTGIDRAFT_199614 [Lottia gigantea]